MYHEVNFLCQVEVGEIGLLGLPKGHTRNGDDRQFLWDGHKEGMLMFYVQLNAHLSRITKDHPPA